MATIDDLVNSTTDLLTAVNVSKATLDAKVAEASASALTATSLVTDLTAVDGSTSKTLTGPQVKATTIHNVGQAGAVDLALPTADANMNFLMIAGATNAYAWRIKASATDKFYLNGLAGTDGAYVGMTAPTVGSYISVFSFKTGASTYDWMVVVGNGNWAVS